MNLAIGLAAVITLIFVLLGVAKVLALPPMRALATENGFSVEAYRGIGVLEIAGAIGVALGPAAPLLGGLAAAGLLLLLAGALITHVRTGAEPRKAVPALICAVLVAGYLTALIWAVP
jgi:hypothetical protein